MSDNCHLQALFSSPRNTTNPKVAHSYTPQFSTGDDGKLYKLASEGDKNKFFILSDAEVEEELRVSQEMADTLRTINPKIPPKSASRGVKLGTSSRTTKIEKRAWEKKLAAADKSAEGGGEGGGGGESKGPEMSSEETMLQSVADLQKKYAANLSVIERLISEKVQLEEKVKELQKQLRQSKKLNKFQSAQQFKKNKTEQLVNGNATIPSVDALKSYYTQNLDLIESLYAQQKSTEVKLVSYLNELTEIKKEKQSSEQTAVIAASSSSPPLDSILSSVSENNDKYLRNLALIEQLFAERKSLKAEAESYKSKFYSLKRTTAMNENGSSGDGQEQGQGQVGAKSRIRQEGLNQTAPGALQKLAVDNLILARTRTNENNVVHLA
mmetsp:Transcript_27584/g.46647  ORF Transcript_27584/g.46647 Transcript_27584/m.46647 type:complete len:382 (+) Transcript_27584:118-1263(+)